MSTIGLIGLCLALALLELKLLAVLYRALSDTELTSQHQQYRLAVDARLRPLQQQVMDHEASLFRLRHRHNYYHVCDNPRCSASFYSPAARQECLRCGLVSDSTERLTPPWHRDNSHQ